MNEGRRTTDRDATTLLTLDDEVRSALRMAIRALEDCVAAAVAGAELTGATRPDIASYESAAVRLREVLHHA
jgi:hypothetical protein